MTLYYGLRAYGTHPQVWGGDPACDPHEWGMGHAHIKRRGDVPPSDAGTFRNGKAYLDHALDAGYQGGAYCTRCAAWRGELGSEPTPEQFVASLVAVFREVKRVLHPTGIVLCNLGDSYAGSGKGPTGHNGIQNAETRQGFTAGYVMQNGQVSRGGRKSKTDAPAGYKAKDLMQMPARVAMALQADGWYLRSTMPWLKRAAMPESVTDRPSNALEWLFLFSKAPRYFWDADAIRQQAQYGYRDVTGAMWGRSQAGDPRDARNGGSHAVSGAHSETGRAFRNTDPWRISLDAAIADARADLARLESMRATGGVLLDDDGLPLAVDVNPQGFNDWTPSVKRVRVTRDAASDDTIRIGSPDCPVHADRPAPAATTPCDGRTAESPSDRSTRSDDRPDQGRLADSASTARPHGADSVDASSDSTPPPCAQSATPHSTRSRRTDHDPATTPPCMPSAENLSRTGDKSGVSADPDSVGRTYASNSDGLGTHPPSDTRASIAHNEAQPVAFSACTCSYYDETKTSVSHFATFPPNLVVPFVKAGTSERGCCPRCLAPYGRLTERAVRPHHRTNPTPEYARSGRPLRGPSDAVPRPINDVAVSTLGWAAGCKCEAGEPVKATVLDCFAGSGTTLLVADRLGRNAIGIELSPEYAAMCEARIRGDAALPGMAEVETAAHDTLPLWEEAI